MQWGTFTFIHIITILLGILILIILDKIISKINYKNKIRVLFILSLTGVSAIIYNLLYWGNPLEYLPLHLCSLNAIALPIVIITRNKLFGNVLLLWSIGAFLAIVVNYDMSTVDVFSSTFMFYYFPHLFEFGIPIILFKKKIIIKDKKYIVTTVAITLIAYTLIHFINICINYYCMNNNIVNSQGEYIIVNYMFSIYPQNPVLSFFYKVLPYSYWYMFLVIPIVILYLKILYKSKSLETHIN